MTSPSDILLAIVDLEPRDGNCFRGRNPEPGWRRIFGGQVLAQALLAAARTVDDRVAHSLHAYFLLPGDPDIPIDYRVEVLRDGRSFSARSVIARQAERTIFTCMASFQVREEGLEHQPDMPDVPGPDDVPDGQGLLATWLAAASAQVRRYWLRERPVEIRLVDPVSLVDGSRPNRRRIWMRAAGPLPDDPAIHAAILAYASDMTLLDTAMMVHGGTVLDPRIQAASVDHALWLHGSVRADDWLLYDEESPWTGAARGLANGRFFERQGGLVATVAQEGLIRPRVSVDDIRGGA